MGRIASVFHLERLNSLEYIQYAMIQRALAVLLVLSWMIFSGIDMLEDLDFEAHAIPSATISPTTAKPVKLANDNVELANRTSLFFTRFFRRMDLESNTPTKLLDSDSRIPRSHHKDNCVFLI